MAYFNFDKSLQVDNKLIDQEHKVLVDLVNGLKDAVDLGNPNRVLDEILPGLLEYTKTHFFVEEELMLAYDYPDFEGHKKAHDAFRNKIEALAKQLSGTEGNIPNSIMLFLKEWLTTHIMETDKKLSAFLKETGMK